MARSKKSEVIEKNAIIVNAKLDGATNAAAARAAGLTSIPNHPDRREEIAAAVAAARTQLSDVCQIRRVDLIAIMQDAIEIARLMADPAAMIKGAAEIGKMLGMYEPEVKEIKFTEGQARMRSKLAGMPESDLLALANGQVLDGFITEAEPPVEH